MDIIPEDSEYFSTDIKYKFHFDKKQIVQSNILEICDGNESSEESNTASIEECDNDSCNLDANGEISLQIVEKNITRDIVEDTGIVE